MAVIGGIFLVIIGTCVTWVYLMNKFGAIGERVVNKIDKTFKEKKEND